MELSRFDKLLVASKACDDRLAKEGEEKGIFISPFVASVFHWDAVSSYADGKLITSGKPIEIGYPYEEITFEVTGYSVVENPDSTRNELRELLREWASSRGWLGLSSSIGEVQGYVNAYTFEIEVIGKFFPRASLEGAALELGTRRVEVAVSELVKFADELFLPRSKIWIDVFDILSPGGASNRELGFCAADMLEGAFLELGSEALVLYRDALIGQRDKLSFTQAAALTAGALVI